jgi:hypothetical protein
MGSPPRTAREEEQRLNLRTLVIASAASATAALVTSRLWIAGTWIAAALTPVIVTFVSEMLRRPTERIARGITSDRPALPDPGAPPARPESAAAQRVAERLRGDVAPLPDPEAPRAGTRPGPTRVYRSEATRTAPRRRKIAYRVIFGTAALAFAIGVLALTVPELIAGGSVGKNDGRTTLFGGPAKSERETDRPQQRTTPEPTDTEEQPDAQTPTTEQPTTPETETTPEPPPPETAPPGEPLPPDTAPTTPAVP